MLRTALFLPIPLGEAMGTQNDEIRWYALYVRQRYEKIVESNLLDKGFEVFLPIYRSKRRWSDRTKVIEQPLFPGYVFCRFDFHNRLPILIVPGVNFVVGLGQTATPIDPSELSAIQRAVNSGLPCEPWSFLKVGHQVRVKYGPLAGLEGFVLEVGKTCKLIISLNLLGRSVAVELHKDDVSPVTAKTDQQKVTIS
jgi:transcription antitermination factor NusG